MEIREEKITRYFLNISHEKGGPTAIFFLRRGFKIDERLILINALATHAADDWPGTRSEEVFGPRHEVIGPMFCPDGTFLIILSIWQFQRGGNRASFVTAYPQ
jgi:hypothetical protein